MSCGSNDQTAAYRLDGAEKTRAATREKGKRTWDLGREL